MGQTLSEPITSKQTATCQNAKFCVGSSCMQGWRTSMEDAHAHILALPDDPSAAYFAVYDGHGGEMVAKYASKHLHKLIVKRPEYAEDVAKAMKQGFLDLDKELLHSVYEGGDIIGSTAVAVLYKNQHLYCANAGDSRAIACVNGQVEVLSKDHKPDCAAEAQRICEAGGYVEYNRVNGNLGLSRALGDFVYKRNISRRPEEQIVSAVPDVETRLVNENWEFLVIACDGIWDMMSNQAVLNFVRRRIGIGKLPEQICEELLNRCLAADYQAEVGGPGGDNMTVVLVCFLHNKPYSALVERCRDRFGGNLRSSASGTGSSKTTLTNNFTVNNRRRNRNFK